MTARWTWLALILALAAPSQALADDKKAPASLDDLFALDESDAKPTSTDGGKAPESLDALFDLAPATDARLADEAPLPAGRDALFGEAPASTAAKPAEAASPWRGYFQAEMARIYASPAHWSKAMGRLELGTQGRLAGGAKWKLSGRVDYNAIFDLDDYYARATRKDQRAEFHVRETYLDFSAADLEWRVGRQHIVWGEMVGLFFADVVSAKDLREFVLPDFQLLRIPQWAARAEHFGDDFHVEAIWIPFPSYDEVGRPGPLGGKPGADYFAYPAFATREDITNLQVLPNILSWDKPSNKLSHTNYGLRLSRLTNGWDVTGFVYSSMDSAPSYRRVKRTAGAVAIYDYRAEHRRIHQAGATLAKDLGPFVLKGEAIYTHGRRYNIRDAADFDANGTLVRQHTLDWVVGLEFTPGADTRVNTQLFQRIYRGHDARIIPDRVESGASLLVNHKLARNWEVDALLIRSLNRGDWLFRPKLVWNFQQDWRMTVGADIFGGPADGLFGQFDNRDRVYGEVRYDF